VHAYIHTNYPSHSPATIANPDDAAWAALPPDRMARLQSDSQALRTLLAFHTLSNAQGDYPRSTTGKFTAALTTSTVRGGPHTI